MPSKSSLVVIPVRIGRHLADSHREQEEEAKPGERTELLCRSSTAVAQSVSRGKLVDVRHNKA